MMIWWPEDCIGEEYQIIRLSVQIGDYGGGVTTRALNRTDPMPLWAQLVSDLRRRIQAGEFADRMPTDHDLTDSYEVSRHTVREAIRRLQDEGVVERRQGSGTFLREVAFEQTLNEIYSLFRSVEAEGIEQHSTVLSQELRTSPLVADRLEVPAERELFYLERIRYAGDLPLAVDRAYLPMPMASPLLEVDFRHTALYDELGRKCGLRPERGVERLHPVIPSPADRKALDMGEGQPALEIVRMTHSAGRPLEHRTTVMRGDRYSFRVEWQNKAGAGETPAFVSQVEATA